MAEETSTPPGPGVMITKPTATSNSTNCISSSSSSSSLDVVRGAPRSEPSRDESSTGLSMNARPAFDGTVTGQGAGVGGGAKASTSSSSMERERSAPSPTEMVRGQPPMGAMQSKCLLPNPLRDVGAYAEIVCARLVVEFGTTAEFGGCLIPLVQCPVHRRKRRPSPHPLPPSLPPSRHRTHA